MKQFSQKFYKKATTSVTLQTAERRELRERLVSYMEYHPLPAELRTKQKNVHSAPTMTEAFTFVKVPFHALFKYGALTAAFFFVALPFVAQNAMPGDTLYAVKVQFNEELRSTLTFDSLQKVEWETERLNRRLAEARLLASEGRLTEVMETEVAMAVRTHTESAKREIEVLRTKDADEAAIASITLETTLAVQATALKEEEAATSLAVNGEEALSAKVTNSPIADAIDESRDKTLEADVNVPLPAYDKLMARVEQNTTRIYELYTALSKTVSAEDLAGVTRRIEDLERSIDEVIALSEVDEVKAQQSLVAVMQRTQRVIIFINELIIAKTVDIETLVPMVPTTQEKKVNIASTTEALTVELAQIELMLATVTDEEVTEKAQLGKATILSLMEKMASSTEEHDVFVALGIEAQILSRDTITLLERFYTPATEENDEDATTKIESGEQITPAPAASEQEGTTDQDISQVLENPSTMLTTRE